MSFIMGVAPSMDLQAGSIIAALVCLDMQLQVLCISLFS